MLALKAQRLPEEKIWPVLDSQWKDRVSRRTDDLFGHMSFQFFVPFPSIPQSKFLEKNVKIEQIAQWKSPSGSCLLFMSLRESLSWPDHVCPDPQAVPSPSGTQAMCFGGKPHKRDLAGGRKFQKKPWPLRAKTPARNPSGCGENVKLPKRKWRGNLKANESSDMHSYFATLWAASRKRGLRLSDFGDLVCLICNKKQKNKKTATNMPQNGSTAAPSRF